MSAKTFTLCRLLIVIALGVLISMSVVSGQSIFLPLGGIIVALLLMRLCRRLTREIMVDERVRHIDEKAAALSYRVFSIVLAMIALTFIMLRTSLPPEYAIVGEALAYAVCGLMLLHSGFYYYYQRRL